MFGVILPGSEKIAWKPGIPEYETLRSTIGGPIEAVTIGAPAPGRELTAWVHEEGLILNLEPAAVVERWLAPGRTSPVTIRGPIVIAASNTRTGETEPVTEAEAAEIELGNGKFLISFEHGRMIPALEWAGVPSRKEALPPEGSWPPGYAGEPPAGMDYSEWLARMNID